MQLTHGGNRPVSECDFICLCIKPTLPQSRGQGLGDPFPSERLLVLNRQNRDAAALREQRQRIPKRACGNPAAIPGNREMVCRFGAGRQSGPPEPRNGEMMPPKAPATS